MDKFYVKLAVDNDVDKIPLLREVVALEASRLSHFRLFSEPFRICISFKTNFTENSFDF